MKIIASAFCWLLAVAVFYGIFFKLAPYICTMVPSGQWQGLIKVIVYFAVAYLGGIGLPFILITVGVFLYINKESY